jgi:CheY-like chemotaxis protein
MDACEAVVAARERELPDPELDAAEIWVEADGRHRLALSAHARRSSLDDLVWLLVEVGLPADLRAEVEAWIDPAASFSELGRRFAARWALEPDEDPSGSAASEPELAVRWHEDQWQIRARAPIPLVSVWADDPAREGEPLVVTLADLMDWQPLPAGGARVVRVVPALRSEGAPEPPPSGTVAGVNLWGRALAQVHAWVPRFLYNAPPEGAEAALAASTPDVVVMDLRRRSEEPFNLVRRMKGRWPRVHRVALAPERDRELVRRAYQAGFHDVFHWPAEHGRLRDLTWLTAPADVFGSYRLLEELGAGGVGVVYAVESADTGERFALKVLRDEGALHDGRRERLRREGQLQQELRHPHVVRAVGGSSTITAWAC